MKPADVFRIQCAIIRLRRKTPAPITLDIVVEVGCHMKMVKKPAKQSRALLMVVLATVLASVGRLRTVRPALRLGLGIVRPNQEHCDG